MPNPADGLFSKLRTIFTEPALSGFFRAFYNDWTAVDRPASLQDESIGDFISRRFHPNLADNIVSAVFHGIYAGDIYSLSVKSLLPSLWEAETYYDVGNTGELNSTSHVISALLAQRRKGPLIDMSDQKLMELMQVALISEDRMNEAERRFAKELKYCSVFTLRGGLGQLSDRLVQDLKANPNVSIRTDCYVQEIEPVQGPDRSINKVMIMFFPAFLATDSLYR